MKCPFCEANTSVEISRPGRKAPSVWRRRQCERCNRAFSTREKPDLSLSFKVKKGSGHKEAFSEDKLLISVYECLSHRKDALEASRALSETMIRMLLPRESGVIEKVKIKTVVLKVLKRFDKAAFTYYKVHHQ